MSGYVGKFKLPLPSSDHTTRISDSSLYDEICTKCGATDAAGDDRLDKPCNILDNLNPIPATSIYFDKCSKAGVKLNTSVISRTEHEAIGLLEKNGWIVNHDKYGDIERISIKKRIK